jgi:hypothetical protein
MEVAAAAATLALPVGTLKARLSRARALLRQRFPRLEEECVSMEAAVIERGKEAVN